MKSFTFFECPLKQKGKVGKKTNFHEPFSKETVASRARDEMEPEEVSAADDAAPSTALLDASQVADYLLSRRHLAAAFELYQDFLSSPPTPHPSEKSAAAPSDENHVNNNDDDARDGALMRESEASARGALEAYFADPRRFPLADLQRYADAVDSE